MYVYSSEFVFDSHPIVNGSLTKRLAELYVLFNRIIIIIIVLHQQSVIIITIIR